MSIKVQKILCFIPVVNLIVTLFCWFLMLKNSGGVLTVFKTFFKLALVLLPVCLLHSLLADKITSQPLSSIIAYVFLYLYLLGPSLVFVHEQKSSK
ncbi:MAG: hypothetical protein IJO76_02130 [Clostridia bacterium]|nr:hypothetical protein [Clostridia bacterium]